MNKKIITLGDIEIEKRKFDVVMMKNVVMMEKLNGCIFY